MFSWFKKKSVDLPAKSPPPAAAPPSTAPAPATQKPVEAVGGTIAFSNTERSWTETFEVVQSLADVLTGQGIFSTRELNSLSLDTSGFVLSPVMTFFKPGDKKGCQTTTIIRIKHPTLIPDGLFEFQHSFGDTVADSLTKGFAQWAQTDLVTLLDSLEVKPSRCTMMAMTFPARDGNPPLRRRVVLGPVSHMTAKKPDPAGPAEEHPFCGCCLLTNSIEPFKPFLESGRVVGIRLFAMRGPDGTASADCRINGEEFEPGKAALRKYVEKWPDRGVEFRKQYILMRNAFETEQDRP